MIVYLYASGIPQYNKAKWESGVDFNDNLPLPAAAFIEEDLQVNLDGDSLLCYEFMNNGTLGIPCPSQAFEIAPSLYLNPEEPSLYYQTFIFNSTKLLEVSDNGLDFVDLSFNFCRPFFSHWECFC